MTYENNPDHPYEGINMIIFLELQTGQQVWVQPSSINSMFGANSESGMYYWFSGYLIYAF